MNTSDKRKIIDAHVHLYDHQANHYDFLENVDPMFLALVGDYSTLPRRYLLDDYLCDEPALDVTGLVWHEFLSADPVREVLWAQQLAATLPVPMSIIGLVDFLAPDMEARLDIFADCPNVAGVREHLGWDESKPLRRFAKRPDLLTNLRWREGLKTLSRYRFKCSLEVFSPQLPDLLEVVWLNPSIGFSIAVIGWPLATDDPGFNSWKKGLAELSRCDNTRIIISALECVFGMSWSLSTAQRWIDTVFELFGPGRIMLGGHHPICGLSSTFPASYTAYRELASGLSESEQDAVFRLNAAEWFFPASTFSTPTIRASTR